jgi:hypothetical protein
MSGHQWIKATLASAVRDGDSIVVWCNSRACGYWLENGHQYRTILTAADLAVYAEKYAPRPPSSISGPGCAAGIAAAAMSARWSIAGPRRPASAGSGKRARASAIQRLDPDERDDVAITDTIGREQIVNLT